MIIMVTGLGGALSQILRETPAVDAIAQAVVATGLPAIFLPFVLGIAGNMITGSTTVGVITAASVAAPMMNTLGLSPEATMLAGAAGSLERTAYAHIRLYKTGKRTDREGKGRERTARDKVHREEALGRAWLTFSGSLWSFQERAWESSRGPFRSP